jgi:hypothetical protein
MSLDRRRFLQLTAAGVVAGLTDSGCAGEKVEDTSGMSQPALLGMLGPQRVREIGAAYRAAVPKENSAAALRDAISASQRGRFPWTSRRSIAEQIQDDFAAGRTVIAGGWLLSETEARQAALYSLSA